MNWLRLYHGTSTDPKWRAIAKAAEVPVSVVLAVWMTMLENASEATNRGELEGWEPEYVAITLETEKRFIVSVYDAMQGRVLKGNALTGWCKRQPKREVGNDLSTERVKKHREKKRNETTGNDTKRTEERDKRDILNTNTVALQARLKAGFQTLWGRYPIDGRDGRKEAEKHYTASVTTDEHLAEITTALDNYIEHLSHETWKKPKNAKTWFNNWRDWTERKSPGKRPMPATPVPQC